MNNKSFVFLIGSLLIESWCVIAQEAIRQKTDQSTISKVWVSDLGNGNYKNPILHADYSDPDVIRVGSDFYMTASSFNYVPGLPILHSKDLVNWSIVSHVFKNQQPIERFNTVQHGGGVWAPSIRFHNNEFFIFYPDPDEGIYMTKSKSITGPWTTPMLIKKAKGWIDPCPFWDEDGNAYLVNALAASRSGIKSILVVNRMSQDGTALLDGGVMVFDGHQKHPTVEGPKIYKRNGYYYILAPAGGVGKGWQLALRSKNIYGPYEEKIVLEQGKSSINGPHQGGLVDTPMGESWFIHFQDKDAYGRIVHLEPVTWRDNWPFIGIDTDGNGIGEPVLSYRKPNVGKNHPVITPQESDEFNGNALGPQWQWCSNPGSNYSFAAGSSYGVLRLFNVPTSDTIRNLWMVPNIVSQKFPAPDFTATTKFTFIPQRDQEETGLIITGIDYAYISLKKSKSGLVVTYAQCINAEGGVSEERLEEKPISSPVVYFRVSVHNIPAGDHQEAIYHKAESSLEGDALCKFSYSIDNQSFTEIGKPFAAKKGKWTGAKVGLFAIGKGKTYETGYSDFDWFRIEK